MKSQVDLCINELPSGLATQSDTNTVEPVLIATEMLAFSSKSSGNKNDSDLMNGKIIPI